LAARGCSKASRWRSSAFLVKESRVDGIAYDWREYLLAGDGAETRGTYRWLTEYNGHWNIADVLSNRPAGGGAMELADVNFLRAAFPALFDRPIRRGHPGRRRIYLARSPRRDQPGGPTTSRRRCCCRANRPTTI
jgi:hypothetical protein